MPKYLFAYHGGSMPETPEAGAKVMEAWNDWFAKIGPSLADGGSACGKSATVNANGSVSAGGGANPVSGYTVVNAADQDEANGIAKGCPILVAGGSVEVAVLLDM